MGGEATGRRGLTAAAGRRRARSCDAHHPPGPQAPPPARPAPLGPLALPGSPGEEPGLCTRRLLEKNSTDGGFEPASSAHSLTHIEVTARRPLGLRWPPHTFWPGDPGTRGPRSRHHPAQRAHHPGPCFSGDAGLGEPRRLPEYVPVPTKALGAGRRGQRCVPHGTPSQRQNRAKAQRSDVQLTQLEVDT